MKKNYFDYINNTRFPLKSFSKIYLLLILFFGLFVNVVNAQKTWNGSSGTNWNTAANWTPSVVPQPTDNVIIPNVVNQPTISLAAAVCNNLTINTGATLTVGASSITVNGTTAISGTLAFSSTAGTQTFIGTVTINLGGTWNNTVNELVTFRGGITNNGTFNAGTGIQTFNTNNQSLSGTLTIPNVTVATVSLTNNDVLNVSTALSGNGALNNTATGVLNIGGTSGITTLTATATGNTVNYNGVAAQTAKVTIYSNLTLSGSGNKTFTTTPTVNGTLSMEGTAAAVVTGTGVVNYGPNATLQYNKTAAYSATLEEWPANFSGAGGVRIINTGVITLGSAKNVTNNFSIVLGSSVNLGTFTHTAGTLMLNGDNTASGSWGSTTSAATYKNNTYFTATTGVINVSTASCTTGYWTGNTSTDWKTPTNWCGSTLPTATTNVVIPAGVANMPTITTTTNSLANNLTINVGATLTLENSATALLDINGDFTNNGTFTSSGASIVRFVGTTNVRLQGTSNTTFSNLIINKNATVTTVTNSAKVFAVSNNLTVTQGNLVLTATDADYTIGNNLTVAAAGTLTHNVAWNRTPSPKLLLVSGNLDIAGVYSYSGAYVSTGVGLDMPRAHIQMNGIGKTIRTGASALSILTIANPSGVISASGTVTVNDNLWAPYSTAGTFETAGNTINANGALLVSGGTLQINGGTVNVSGGLYLGYDGALAGVANFMSGIINADFINIGFNNTTTPANSRMGTFNHSGGTANIRDVIINNVGTSAYICSGTPTINVSGNWTNNRTFTAASSTVNFTGTATQTINGNLSGSTGRFYNLTFNGLGGNWTNNAPMEVSGVLNMQHGILTTSETNILNITNTLSTASSGGTTTSFINGPLRWTLPNGASATTFNFPVGKGTTYLPFSLVNPSTSSIGVTAQVQAFNTNCGGTADLSIIATLSTTEYWSLITAPNFTNSSVSLYKPTTAISPFDVIGGSTVVGGTYSSLGGTIGTNEITISTAIGTNRFFTFGRRNEIRTSTTITGPFCAGEGISVPYTITGTYTVGNVFTAQLSNDSGSFTSPVVIGTLPQTTAGTISAILPTAISAGTGYRIRVISSNPSVTGQDNGTDLIINDAPIIASISSPSALCSGGSLNPSAPTVTVNGSTVTASGWQLETAVSSGTYSNLTVAYTVAYADNGKRIRYYATNGCGTTYSNAVAITVNDAPSIASISSPSALCSGGSLNPAAPTVTINGSVLSSQGWEISTTSGGSSYTALTVPYTVAFSDNGKNIRYSATNGCGTTTSNVVILTVNPTPATPTFGTITNTNCVATTTGSIILNGLPPSGSWTINQTGTLTTSYPGSGTAYTVTGLVAGTYTFTVTNANGCPSLATSSQAIISEPSTTWNGSGWSNGVPTILKAIIFDGDYASDTSGGHLEGCSCQVNAGKNVVFKSVGTNSGHTLKVTNEVTVVGTGTLTFENNASLVQTKDAAENVNINSGNINYKRHTNYVRRYDFTYWSSPVVGQTLYNLSPTTLGDKFYGFNSAGNNWTIYYNGNQEMLPGEGYLIRAPQTFDITTAAIDTSPEFKGKPNNGIITKNLDAGKLYLLGNPYPSALDADEFLYTNKDVLDGTLYFWTHNTAIQLATNITNGTAGSGVYAYTSDDYASYNRTGGISTAVSAISDPKHSFSGVDLGLKPTGKIAAGQGFFAPASTIGGKLIFNNGMRASGSGDNSQFFKLSTASKTTIQKDRVWLNLTNKEGAFKQTLIGYITGATNDYDEGFDAVTYDANPFVDFYSVNNQVNLVIQGRALPFVKKDSVALGYKSAIKGEFQISIDLTDGALATQKIFLEDQDLKVLHDLKKEPYTFNTEKGVFNNRFVLRYVDKNAIEVELSKEVIVSVLDKKITINSALTTIDKVVLYDMTGRKLFQKNRADANVFVIPNLVWNHQVLVVDVVLSDGTKHTRKIVN